jgi:hypothetical protein
MRDNDGAIALRGDTLPTPAADAGDVGLRGDDGCTDGALVRGDDGCDDGLRAANDAARASRNTCYTVRNVLVAGGALALPNRSMSIPCNKSTHRVDTFHANTHTTCMPTSANRLSRRRARRWRRIRIIIVVVRMSPRAERLYEHICVAASIDVVTWVVVVNR